MVRGRAQSQHDTGRRREEHHRTFPHLNLTLRPILSLEPYLYEYLILHNNYCTQLRVVNGQIYDAGDRRVSVLGVHIFFR